MSLGLLRRLFAPAKRESVQAQTSAQSSAPEESRPRIRAAVELPVRNTRASSDHPQLAEDIVPVDVWLQNRLSAAIRELDATTVGTERTSAFLTLLGRIAGDPAGRLRRPPAAAQRAMIACRGDNVQVDTLVQLLEADPALTQAILARANSAYYSRGGPRCLSLRDAIVRQGRQSVHNVLLEQTMNTLVYTGTGSIRRMVDEVWSHMVRTAPLARDLAAAFNTEPEQAFALSLLHDVGKLVVFDRIATLRTAERSELAITGPALSRTLRLLHEPLGGHCALGWDLGDDAARAIASHHRAGGGAPDKLTEVIWLAEQVDLARVRNQAVDLPALWSTGRLTGDLAATEQILAATP
jgi:HD-like signal output (HDOD) protein